MRFAAFIRNVMIGREGLHRQVLLGVFADAGAIAPRSYISTGNVTFSAPPRRAAAIGRAAERGIEAVIGRSEGVYLRRIDYLRELIASDPFAAAPYPDPFERTVSFTPEPIEPPRLPIESERGDVAVFAATSGELFAVNRMIDGRTSGSGGMVEKVLGRPVTTRSWNTVLRVVADPE